MEIPTGKEQPQPINEPLGYHKISLPRDQVAQHTHPVCIPRSSFPTSVVEPGQIYAFCNVVLDPVAVPPFLRVNLDASELHAEVNMVASGHSGLAARAHDLASFHHVAFVHSNLAQVAVDRL